MISLNRVTAVMHNTRQLARAAAVNRGICRGAGETRVLKKGHEKMGRKVQYMMQRRSGGFKALTVER